LAYAVATSSGTTVEEAAAPTGSWVTGAFAADPVSGAPLAGGMGGSGALSYSPSGLLTASVLVDQAGVESTEVVRIGASGTVTPEATGLSSLYGNPTPSALG
jgi:hypothetical protein